MSCNGCRVLRRGCSEQCILRPCLEWIERPQAQANATLFVSKFFGRSDLMSFIAAVPEHRRPALFQSLLFEACGRTVNPVNGAVGLLSTGNWHVCKAAVETILSGGSLLPVSAGAFPQSVEEESEASAWNSSSSHSSSKKGFGRKNTPSLGSATTELSPEIGGGKQPKLLNLFT